MIDINNPSKYLTYNKINDKELLKQAINKFGNYKKAIEKLNKFFIEIASQKIKKSFSWDLLIAQEIELIQEIDKIVNILYERLRELYGFYFPEAIRNQDLERFVKTIEKNPNKNFVSKKLKIKSLNLSPDIDNLIVFQQIAKEINNILKLKEFIEKDIKKQMKKYAPNLSKTAGELLGAKLISLAGGIKNLAKLPSSTIQILGAEKALFRHIVKGSKPPKHGIILQHPDVSSSKNKDRGKAARQLAGKISKAVKVDYFRGKENEN